MTNFKKRQLTPSQHQAAGHDGCMTSDSLFIKPTTRQELDFYQRTLELDEASHEEPLLGALLSHWMPPWLGQLSQSDIDSPPPPTSSSASTLEIATTQDSSRKFIVLQNLYHGIIHPNILDIKLGSTLTDDKVTPKAKIERLRQVSLNTTSGTLGFRICGMKVYQNHHHQGKEQSQVVMPRELFKEMQSCITADSMLENIEYDGVEREEKTTYLEFNKYFGRGLDVNNIADALRLFFANLHHAKMLIHRFVQRLQLLHNCLLSYHTRMYSASLLFVVEGDSRRWSTVNGANYDEFDPLVYEFDPAQDDEEDDEEKEEDEGDKVIRIPLGNPSRLSGLYLIDFAHSKHVDAKEGLDDNVLDGIENLIEIFAKL
ncbi:uncharacterized protein LODBEIA_P37370 [Lodderomyces beijingensis]|uniref:Kinase n=1 Tax=Lodderomyces beijingensis TaxID=1775926 RepID=A0ABP0ZPB3_9ASCO